MTDLNTNSGAVFSPDKKYRYGLWRKWRLHGKYIMFIGLNPSRADEVNNDLTITKLIHFARSWGYDGIYMTNLFGWIEPDSAFIKTLTEENLHQYVGENDEWLDLFWKDSDELVFCWGDFKNVSIRSKFIMDKYGPALCFGKTKSGAPKHPSRLAYSTKLIFYN